MYALTRPGRAQDGAPQTGRKTAGRPRDARGAAVERGARRARPDPGPPVPRDPDHGRGVREVRPLTAVMAQFLVSFPKPSGSGQGKTFSSFFFFPFYPSRPRLLPHWKGGLPR